MSILSTAYTGLNAFQRALAMTGNNIANATTKGYSRQTIQLMPSLTQKFGRSYLGTGVNVASIVRNVDQFANYQLRGSISLRDEHDAFFQQASQIDKLLSQTGVGLSSTMQSFFSALGELNNYPDNAASRNVMLKQSQLLASQFNYLQDKIDQYQTNSTVQITGVVKQVNRISADLAEVNKQLLVNKGAPDLLDQRDSLLNELSQYIDITVIDQSNGTITVGLTSGEALVTGTYYSNLVATTNLSGSFGTQITLNGVNVTSKFTSGSIKGLLDFEQNVVGKSSQLIGQLAIGLAQKFNHQQSLGLDLNDSFGTNFFTDYSDINLQLARSIATSTNTGTAQFAVDISDISATVASDYELSFDGANYNLLRKSDGVITTFAPGALPYTVDGLTISLNSGAIAAGDSFTLVPTRWAARNFDTLISDQRDIALAAAVRTSPATTNQGQGVISLGAVLDTTTPANAAAINTNYSITMTNTTDYTIAPGGATGTIVPGTDNTLYFPPGTTAATAAYSVVLSGTPATGDVYNLVKNDGAYGDNRNGLLLSEIQQNKFFSGGTESLVDRYSNLVANVGAETNQAKLRYDSADVLYKQASDFQSSKSGVNLDEEAANLLKFKQSYEAAGKLMQTANELISILFDALR